MHNMGLCMNPRAMLNKFLIALAFSQKIHDSPPDERWYKEVRSKFFILKKKTNKKHSKYYYLLILKAWVDFHPLLNNEGLEMAEGYRNDLPYAYDYNPWELPARLRELFLNDKVC